MRTLICEGFWGFYSSVELTSVPWQTRSFLVGKILINARILRSPFLVEILLTRVDRGRKMFPYIFMCGGQAKPCWVCQELLYLYQLLPVGFPSCLGVLVVKPQMLFA